MQSAAPVLELDAGCMQSWLILLANIRCGLSLQGFQARTLQNAKNEAMQREAEVCLWTQHFACTFLQVCFAACADMCHEPSEF